jgi:hypothetical protein
MAVGKTRVQEEGDEGSAGQVGQGQRPERLVQHGGDDQRQGQGVERQQGAHNCPGLGRIGGEDQP